MKSIFDGWEKQSKNAADDDGGRCAFAYLTQSHGVAWVEDLPHDVQSRFQSVGEWILNNMEVPSEKRATYFSAIIWASDGGHLNPDGFRMVALLCQGYVPEEHASYTAEEVTR